MNLLEIKELTKIIGGQEILSNITLSLKKGKILALSGKEEAGKTTLVKLIMGMCHPTQGEILIFGKDAMKYNRQIKGNAGYVPEDILYYKKMRAIQYYKYTMAYRKIKTFEELDYLCELFSFDPEKQFEEMTFEENKIAAIINGLLGNPIFLILDEPFVVLEKENVHILMEELKRRAETGAGVLITCEDPEEIVKDITHAAFLEDGELKALVKVDALNRNRYRMISASGGKQEYFLKIGAKPLFVQEETGFYLYGGPQKLLNQAVLLSDCKSCLIEKLTLKEQALADYERWLGTCTL